MQCTVGILHDLVGSVVLLSIFWYQEARVLTPLLVPFITIIAMTSQVRRMGRTFWVSFAPSSLQLVLTVHEDILDLHERDSGYDIRCPPSRGSRTLALEPTRSLGTHPQHSASRIQRDARECRLLEDVPPTMAHARAVCRR